MLQKMNPQGFIGASPRRPHPPSSGPATTGGGGYPVSMLPPQVCYQDNSQPMHYSHMPQQLYPSSSGQMSYGSAATEGVPGGVNAACSPSTQHDGRSSSNVNNAQYTNGANNGESPSSSSKFIPHLQRHGDSYGPGGPTSKQIEEYLEEWMKEHNEYDNPTIQSILSALDDQGAVSERPRTKAVLNPEQYNNSMGISMDEVVSITHKRPRVVKNRHPKQLDERAVAILYRWMLSKEHFDFPYPTENEKEELARITQVTVTQLNHWFTNARKRLWVPLRRKRNLPVPTQAEIRKMRTQRKIDELKSKHDGSSSVSTGSDGYRENDYSPDRQKKPRKTKADEHPRDKEYTAPQSYGRDVNTYASPRQFEPSGVPISQWNQSEMERTAPPQYGHDITQQRPKPLGSGVPINRWNPSNSSQENASSPHPTWNRFSEEVILGASAGQRATTIGLDGEPAATRRSSGKVKRFDSVQPTLLGQSDDPLVDMPLGDCLRQTATQSAPERSDLSDWRQNDLTINTDQPHDSTRSFAGMQHRAASSWEAPWGPDSRQSGKSVDTIFGSSPC